MNSEKRKAPEGTGADANTTSHDIYMRYTLGSRLRWLDRHRHWWIRSIKRYR